MCTRGDGYVHHLDYSDGFMSVCIDQCVQFVVWELCLNKGIKKQKKEGRKQEIGTEGKRKREIEGE